jgi:hypothetical protein
MALASCSANRPRNQEKQALRLLGIAEGGKIDASCKTTNLASDVSRIFNEYLKGKDVADSLYIAADKIKEASSECTKVTAIIDVTQNPKIEEIKLILGQEDSTNYGQIVDSANKASSIDVLKYGWLGFAIYEGQVIGLTVYFK